LKQYNILFYSPTSIICSGPQLQEYLLGSKNTIRQFEMKLII